MALIEPDVANASTGDLLREAVNDAKTLVRIEVELAKSEVRQEIRAAKGAAIALGIATVAALLGLGALLAAAVVALGPIGGLVLGVALLVVAAVLGAIGYKRLPSKPLDHTRKRLEGDVRTLKEHVA
jgi:uncharacterized membrane protein YqjE